MSIEKLICWVLWIITGCLIILAVFPALIVSWIIDLHEFADKKVKA